MKNSFLPPYQTEIKILRWYCSKTINTHHQNEAPGRIYYFACVYWHVFKNYFELSKDSPNVKAQITTHRCLTISVLILHFKLLRYSFKAFWAYVFVFVWLKILTICVHGFCEILKDQIYRMKFLSSQIYKNSNNQTSKRDDFS